MNELSNLQAPEGANTPRKRKGRGESSGWGKTATKGHKGQKARSGGGKPARGFEGGQMPLARRLPKRGFTSRNRVEYQVVNVAALAEKFEAGAVVDLEALRAAGLVGNPRGLVKVLAHGDLTIGLTVKAHKFSQAAADKIAAAGGTVEVIEA